MSVREECLLSFGLSLITSAAAAAPCTPMTLPSGTETCGVDLVSSYQTFCSGGMQVCLESIQAAVGDAITYFNGTPAPTLPYLISIPQGTYDISSTITIAGQKVKGAFDLTYAGGLSANVKLYIAGQGKNSTYLVTSPQIYTFYGIAASASQRPVSHIYILNMTLTRPNTYNNDEWQSYYMTQGKVISLLPKGSGPAALVVDITPSYPTPDLLYCQTVSGTFTAGINNGPSSCTGTNTSNANNGYIHAYTTNGSDPNQASYQAGASPTNPEFWLGGDTNGQPTNGLNPQINWGVIGFPQPYLLLDQSGQPAGDGRQWVIPLSNYLASNPPAIYSSPGIIACLKMKSGRGSFVFSDQLVGGGRDITFNGIRWLQNGEGIFRGGIAVAQVVNSSLERPSAPPQGMPGAGVTPCIGGSDGGPQFGFNADLPTYGNTIKNYVAISPGDDAVAFDNDEGGGTSGYAASNVSTISVNDSFARDILVDTTNFGSQTCTSNIYFGGSISAVDCDGSQTPPSLIVQCPITYQNRDKTNGCP